MVGPAWWVDKWAEEVRDTLDYLGLQHSAGKWLSDGEAAPRGVVLGYEVDLVANTVTVPEEKRQRLLVQLRRLARATCMRRGELSRLVGWLGHLVRVVPAMAPWCGGLYLQTGAFAASTDTRWARISEGAKRCARRWAQWLAEASAGFLFSTWGCTLPTWVIYTDASEWGGAFWTPEKGVVWWEWAKVWPGYKPKAVHINVLECVTLVTALWWWREEVKGRVVRVRCDNTVTLGVVRKGHCTANTQLQEAVYRWGEVLGAASHRAVVRLEWVASKANLFADAFSRDPASPLQVDREAAQWRAIFVQHAPARRLDTDPVLLQTWWSSWTLRLGLSF